MVEEIELFTNFKKIQTHPTDLPKVILESVGMTDDDEEDELLLLERFARLTYCVGTKDGAS